MLADKIIKDFGVPEKYQKDVKEGVNSSLDIITAYAGMKGNKTMGKLEQAKTPKGINMYLQDGSPMMVPAT